MNNTILEKIKLAEEISRSSKMFPEKTFQIVLNYLLSGGVAIQNRPKQAKNKIKDIKIKNNKKQNKGLGQKINELVSERFFDSAKTSKEIIAKLKLMGYPMRPTSLPSYLLPKLRSKELNRKEIKTDNGTIYGYIRKNK